MRCFSNFANPVAFFLLTFIHACSGTTAMPPPIGGEQPAFFIETTLVDTKTGALITDEELSVRVSGDDKGLVLDAQGIPTVRPLASQGSLRLYFPEHARPSKEAPLRLTISVESPRIVSTSQPLIIDNSEQQAPFAMRIIDKANPPAGVAIAPTIVVGRADDGKVVTGFMIQTPVEPNTKARATVTVPTGLLMMDENDMPLSGSLTAEVVYFGNLTRSSLLSFPGGLHNVLTEQNGMQSVQTFKSAGMVKINIRDSDRRSAKTFHGGAITVSMTVSPKTINPDAGRLVQSGDEIPLWSNDSGIWRYEGKMPIVAAPALTDDGLPSVTFSTNHLTFFNLDWPIKSCAGYGRDVRILDSATNKDLCSAKAARLIWVLEDVDADVPPNSLSVEMPADTANETALNVIRIYRTPSDDALSLAAFFDVNDNGVKDDAETEPVFDYIFGLPNTEKLCDMGGEIVKTIYSTATKIPVPCM